MAKSSFNIHQDPTEHRWMPRCKKRTILILIAIAIMATAVITYTITTKKTEEHLTPPNPKKQLPPSISPLRSFQSAAVCSDSSTCSDIGSEILRKNGSAVDATIATMFCNGLVTMQSMGLGGGFFMTIYSKEDGKIYTLNAREAAPLAATSDMFKNDPNKAKIGALASGVPGELAGYIAAHERFGKLSWAELVQPTIELCEKGFNVSDHQARAIKLKQKDLEKNNLFKILFKDRKNNNFKTSGALVKHDIYCQTLKNISENKNDFYQGKMGDIFVEDVKEMGGIITKADLLRYEPIWEEPISVKLNNYTFYSAPFPANGNILGLILNILQGYNFTRDSFQNETILTHHLIVEAFKHAYGVRTHGGDPKFVNLTKIQQEIQKEDYVDSIRKKIKHNETSQEALFYGAEGPTKDDHGTAHISVLAPNGDAVSVTSTINLYFGASVMSKRTGIILNSGMDDFSSEYVKNYFGLPYSPSNKIEPQKRALSSMSPSIIIDEGGNVKMVVGAAGGTKIPSSVALVIMRALWFQDDIKQAVDAPRFHNQLYPMVVDYEYGLISSVVEGLKKIGHKVQRSTSTGSVINAIFVQNTTVTANADYRKGGDASGF